MLRRKSRREKESNHVEPLADWRTLIYIPIMITLAIDTSTNRGSVALFAYGELALDESFTADRSHTSELFATLDRARSQVTRVDQVVIGLGPGSYAGVRIAISAATGLQLGLGCVLAGIPSVAALETDAHEYLAIGDARRDAFYLTHVSDGVCLRGPELVSESELRAQLELHPTLPVFASEPLPAFPSAPIAYPSAVRLARLAAEGRGIVQEGNLEPIYLREPHITQPKPQAL